MSDRPGGPSIARSPHRCDRQTPLWRRDAEPVERLRLVCEALGRPRERRRSTNYHGTSGRRLRRVRLGSADRTNRSQPRSSECERKSSHEHASFPLPEGCNCSRRLEQLTEISVKGGYA